jgi:hypothetical protein
MCGRARLSADFNEIKLVFNLPPDRPTPNFAPTYNLAPTDPIPIVRRDPDDGQRRLDLVRWGLVPYWARDMKIGYSTFNARSDSGGSINAQASARRASSGRPMRNSQRGDSGTQARTNKVSSPGTGASHAATWCLVIPWGYPRRFAMSLVSA